MSAPDISIVVPCYNQAEYLSEAIQSVTHQTNQNWECIIVNDGSTDGTAAVASEWADKDNRIKLLQIENGGLSNARNKGIEMARGDFILPLDADDKIGPEYIEHAIQQFTATPDLCLVYSKAEKFGSESGPWVLPEFSLFDLAQGNIIFCSSVFRKEDWARIGGYDSAMIYGLEDWEFNINLLKDGGGVVRLDYVGFFYRIKERSMITELSEERDRQMKDHISIKHADFFVSQVGNFLELLDKNKRANQRIKSLYTDRKNAIKALLGINVRTK